MVSEEPRSKSQHPGAACFALCCHRFTATKDVTYVIFEPCLMLLPYQAVHSVSTQKEQIPKDYNVASRIPIQSLYVSLNVGAILVPKLVAGLFHSCEMGYILGLLDRI